MSGDARERYLIFLGCLLAIGWPVFRTMLVYCISYANRRGGSSNYLSTFLKLA